MLLAKSLSPSPAGVPHTAVSSGPQKVVSSLVQPVRRQHGHAWSKPNTCHPLPGMAAAVQSIGVFDGKHDMRKE